MKFIKTLTLVLTLVLGMASIANAQKVIWNGTKINFEKPDMANHLLPQNQDRISDTVWMTRQLSKSLFNLKAESSSTGNSPANTLWAYGTTATISSLTFKTWGVTHGNDPRSTIGKNMVLFIQSDSIYIDIKLSSFSSGSGNGGFAYSRSTPFIYDTMNIFACKSYRNPKTGILYTAQTTYIDTLSGTPLDTIRTFAVNLFNDVASFSVVDSVFTADSFGLQYQWMDCSSGNNVPILDAIDSVFTTSIAGSYALEVNNTACRDTSACFVYRGLSIAGLNKPKLSVYPNPSLKNRDLTIISSSEEIIAVVIYGVDGKILNIPITKISNVKRSIDPSALSQGNYIIQVQTHTNHTISMRYNVLK